MAESGRRVRVLERGHVYFAYRPRVDTAVVKGLRDVARLYMVLQPRRKRRCRSIIIGEKRLPAVTGEGDRLSWGFVESASS